MAVSDRVRLWRTAIWECWLTHTPSGLEVMVCHRGNASVRVSESYPDGTKADLLEFVLARSGVWRERCAAINDAGEDR
jgi:hypothetical protein